MKDEKEQNWLNIDLKRKIFNFFTLLLLFIFVMEVKKMNWVSIFLGLLFVTIAIFMYLIRGRTRSEFIENSTLIIGIFMLLLGIVYLFLGIR